MLNKEEVITHYNQCIKDLGIQPKDLVVSAGAACVMYGVREGTSDIDANVPDELFDKLLTVNKYKISYFTSNMGTVEVMEYSDAIDLHRSTPGIKTTMVQGVCCYSVEEVLKQKMKLNRPKDQADIKALQELILKSK